MDQTLTIEEKVQLAQATKERLDIIDRYNKGREGTDIDPWEDPAFEVYHVTDRYGFIHDHALPIPEGTDTKAKVVENERIQKWVKMFQNWKRYYPSEKVTRRIYKGIPEAMRGQIWCLLLDVPERKQEKPNLYEQMKEVALKWCPLADIRQIDLDVNRTYRDHIMFRKRYDVKQQALFHVLAAYSMYNTDVGYCQGMSQIAALLLMYMNEEDAFWAMTALLNNAKHDMHGFFIPGFPKLLRFQDHHDNILKKFLPKVRKHLEKNDVFSGLYTIKWFMQCFLDRVPFHLTLRLWDIYMLEGERVLVAMSYNYLKIHRRKILKMSMEELLDFFQGSLVKDFGLEDDRVIELLHGVMDDLRRVRMDVPPKGDDALEKPTKPLGVFVPPTIAQLISNGNLEDKEETIESEKRTAANRPNIPADGGPVVLPSPLAKRMSRISSGHFSPSNDDTNDAVTDGASSRASAVEYQSSRTSMVDSLSDVACFNTSGSSEIVTSSNDRSEKYLPVKLDLVGGAESQKKFDNIWRWSGLPESSTIDYDSILANNKLRDQDLERTLENLSETEALGRPCRAIHEGAALSHLNTPLTPTLGSVMTLRNSGINSISSSLVHSPSNAQYLNPGGLGGVGSPPGKLNTAPTLAQLQELDDLLKELGLDTDHHATRSPEKTNCSEKERSRLNSSSDDEVIVIPIEHVSKDVKPARFDSLKTSAKAPCRTSADLTAPLKPNPVFCGVLTPIPVLHLRSVPVSHLRGASPPVSTVTNGALHFPSPADKTGVVMDNLLSSSFPSVSASSVSVQSSPAESANSNRNTTSDSANSNRKATSDSTNSNRNATPCSANSSATFSSRSFISPPSGSFILPSSSPSVAVSDSASSPSLSDIRLRRPRHSVHVNRDPSD